MLTQGLILAAGFSTRLRPLTEKIPKAMLPMFSQTQFDWSLNYLTTAGVKEVAVNVCHGKEPFLNFLKPYKNVTPFVEDPILGTGGGIFNMASFLTTEDVVVINCDFLTHIDLKETYAFHKKNKALATLVLAHQKEKKFGSVSTDQNNRIVSFEKDPQGHDFFSGIHILNRKIFEFKVKKTFFCIIRDVYEPLIKQNEKILGFKTNALWLDTGDLASYQTSPKMFVKKT